MPLQSVTVIFAMLYVWAKPVDPNIALMIPHISSCLMCLFGDRDGWCNYLVTPVFFAVFKVYGKGGGFLVAIAQQEGTTQPEREDTLNRHITPNGGQRFHEVPVRFGKASILYP